MEIFSWIVTCIEAFSPIILPLRMSSSRFPSLYGSLYALVSASTCSYTQVLYKGLLDDLEESLCFSAIYLPVEVLLAFGSSFCFFFFIFGFLRISITFLPFPPHIIKYAYNILSHICRCFIKDFTSGKLVHIFLNIIIMVLIMDLLYRNVNVYFSQRYQ